MSTLTEPCIAYTRTTRFENLVLRASAALQRTVERRVRRRLAQSHTPAARPASISALDDAQRVRSARFILGYTPR